MDVETQARAALRMFITPRRIVPRDWETDLLRQQPPRALANGLVARVWGDGPRVLLAHGWEGRGVNLGGFIAPLTAAGYQAIALDGPAHGDSPGEMTNVMEFARGILDAGSELGPLAGVIAHSMGVATTALALRQGLAAERVVLIAGPSSLSDVMRRFAQMARLPEPVAERFYQLLMEHTGISAEVLDIARIAATLATPALIMHDRADADVPFADGQAIAACWLGASLYITEGLGHRRILRDPEVIAAAVSFLTGSARIAHASERTA